MFFAAGAVGAAAIGALDLLSSLTPNKAAAAKTGVKQTNSLFDLIGANTSTSSVSSAPSASPTPAGALSPSTFNALLSAQDANIKNLFGQVNAHKGWKWTDRQTPIVFSAQELGDDQKNLLNVAKDFDELSTDAPPSAPPSACLINC